MYQTKTTPSFQLPSLPFYPNFFFPIFLQVSLQCFGAAAAITASSVRDWQQGYYTTSGSSVGGLLEAMLHPLGNFGKFLTVLLSLSVAGNNVVTFYSISVNFQAFIPILVAVPRYVFSVVATAV
jgi:purine-cytosine permease-like protein